MAAGTLTSLTPNLALSVCGSRILAVSTWCCTDDRHNTWVSRRARSPDMLLSRGAGGCGCGAPHRSDELPELLHHALAPQLQQDSSTGPPYIKGWIMVLYRRESKASEHGAVCACCSSSGVDRWWVVAVCTTRLSVYLQRDGGPGREVLDHLPAVREDVLRTTPHQHIHHHSASVATGVPRTACT